MNDATVDPTLPPRLRRLHEQRHDMASEVASLSRLRTKSPGLRKLHTQAERALIEIEQEIEIATRAPEVGERLVVDLRDTRLS